jgi:hypothetical protein
MMKMVPASVAIVGTNQVGQKFHPQAMTTPSIGQSRGQPVPPNEQRTATEACTAAYVAMDSTTISLSEPPL